MLKAGRSMKLIDDLDALVRDDAEMDDSDMPGIPFDMLRAAMCHETDAVRCLSAATSAPRNSHGPRALLRRLSDDDSTDESTALAAARRVTCMELACTHPRTSALPGGVELSLIQEVTRPSAASPAAAGAVACGADCGPPGDLLPQGLVNGMRCTSSSTRHKLVALLSKVRAAVQSPRSSALLKFNL